MAINFNLYNRLEPRPYDRDLEVGFASPVADPVWFLGRQWQMGEHQGENATSPVWVNYTLSSRAIQSTDPRFDPTQIPAEAIVESEIDDFWTMGRRVRIGKKLAANPNVQGHPELLFYNPAPPYEAFHGQLDGRAAWRKRNDLGLVDADFGAGVPADSTPAWDAEQLLYQQTPETAFVTEQGQKLTVQSHRGGRMDWYSVDATELDLAPADGQPGEAIPTALQYPGAPASRWWEIEDAEVDPGGYVPDRAHTSTALLTDLVFSHSDDWFLFPVTGKAGNIIRLETLEVTDAFGRVYKSQDVDDAGKFIWNGLHAPKGWTLFQVDGLLEEELVLWHVAELPLESNPLERVQFGLDEESNLLWAVERTVDGREVESRKLNLPDPAQHPRFNSGKPSGDTKKEREYAYVPGQGMAPHWIPYEIDESNGKRLRMQRLLVDLSRQKPMPFPGPEADVLLSATPGQPHHIAMLAIPTNGIEVERRWQLARDMTGSPVLWIERQRRGLMSPPARRLRFDVMEEAVETA